MTKSLLNDAQKRSLSVALRMIEETLDKAETLIERGYYRGITYESVCTVNPQTRHELTNIFQQIRELLGELMCLFDLEPEQRDAARQIYADLFYSWEVAEGVKTNMLKRYGTVASGVAQILDPRLDRLIELVRTAGAKLQTCVADQAENHKQKLMNIDKENDHGS